jgi:hypothetical protein
VNARADGRLLAAIAKRATLAVVLALAVASSCTGDETATTESPSASTTPPSDERTDSPSPALNPDAAGCPVTVPRPVEARYSWRVRLFGWGSSYGNGQLWVGGLGPDGVVDRLDWKFGWWREVPGQLRITGQRLDATAASLHSDVPTGYGRTGFQASGVEFPTEGCWQVTGQAGGASLTFVTLVNGT